MGGYISFEILRQAPERVLRLALLDTSARDDQPQQREQRRQQIEQARAGRLPEVIDAIAPHLLHPRSPHRPTPARRRW
jgi:pimeloyl-ACP methyl ester carboxylesterase